METVSIGRSRTLQSLDGSQKPQVFQGTTQVEQMTSSMVFEVIRLRLHTKAHTGEDKHESRHSIMEGTSRHKGRQQGHTITEG